MDFLHLVISITAAALAALMASRYIKVQPTTRATTVSPMIVLAVIPLLLGQALVSAIGQIPAGSVGVVTRFGAPTGNVLSPGLYTVLPFVTSVYPMDTQIRAYEVDTVESASSDLQTVHANVVVNYHLDPNPASIIKVYANLRDEYERRVINPIIMETLKAITAKFTAQDLIDKRDRVTALLSSLLEQRFASYGIIVDNVSLTQFAFSQQFNDAIEAKVTQEQQALQARAKLDQVRYEAEQSVTKARAEAQALALQRQAVTPELVHLREIEVERAFVEKWDGRMPSVVGSGNLLSLPSEMMQSGATTAHM